MSSSPSEIRKTIRNLLDDELPVFESNYLPISPIKAKSETNIADTEKVEKFTFADTAEKKKGRWWKLSILLLIFTIIVCISMNYLFFSIAVTIILNIIIFTCNKKTETNNRQHSLIVQIYQYLQRISTVQEIDSLQQIFGINDVDWKFIKDHICHNQKFQTKLFCVDGEIKQFIRAN